MAELAVAEGQRVVRRRAAMRLRRQAALRKPALRKVEEAREAVAVEPRAAKTAYT